MPEFKYEITQNVGVLSESATGWSRQVNYVSWNGREPKFDIRDWAPENAKMGKGLSLSQKRSSRSKSCSIRWICKYDRYCRKQAPFH